MLHWHLQRVTAEGETVRVPTVARPAKPEDLGTALKWVDVMNSNPDWGGPYSLEECHDATCLPDDQRED